jgi:23S rRNA pseudouridine1911/1915/1917 synthase
MVGLKVINILFEDNHILVVEKPINVPVQEDVSKDKDFLNMIKEYIKNKYKKPGNVYVGLIHRLDRPVGGLMVFAKTSKAASRLSEQVRQQSMSKHYLAVLEGELKPLKGTLTDKLLKDEKNNIVKVDETGKEAILNYEVLSFADNKTLLI